MEQTGFFGDSPLARAPTLGQHAMMSLVNSLENKFGRYAIPGLVSMIAGLQALVWVLARFQPDFPSWLELNKTLILQGQLWRLVTFVLLPGQSHPVWMLLAILLLLTIGQTLEQAWGAFRVNLYVLGGIVFAAAGVLLQEQWNSFDIVRAADGGTLIQLPASSDAGAMCSFWFGMTIFFAFACVVPEYEILLFMILPMKVKFIALLGGAMLVLDFIGAPELRVPMLFSFLNFFIAIGPQLVRHLSQRSQVAARRARFESAQRPSDAFFHQCASCGKTEIDNPSLEFRVTADGAEYCSACKPAKRS